MSLPRPPQILIVDDDDAHRLMLSTLLKDWGFGVKEAGDGHRAVQIIREGPLDLVLMDVRMPEMDGIEATRRIRRYNPAVPIIMLTAYSSVPSAVEALKAGAYDYLTKPIDFDALRLAMDRALDHTRLRTENQELKEQLSRLQLPAIVGKSQAMTSLVEMLALVAPSEATVLITGESGTGKGLVARAIHANSPRKDGPLVEVNCAAIPENLLESELFGHEKGAFTGADRSRRGRFAQAQGGTLFLDEVGELSIFMQAKLLGVLQDGVIQRVGSDQTHNVDVRVVAATNRDLAHMVREGTFREDLYYRLNVVALEVPPLRDRRDDIPLLCQHFLSLYGQKNNRRVKGLTPQVMDIFMRYDWPGNVRELENVLERAVILMRGEYVTERELPLHLQKLSRDLTEPVAAASASPDMDSSLTLAQMEKRMILRVLEETGGNKSEAARRLGITRRTLKLKLKKYAEEESAEN
ncbi:two-component system, NtrC family, response regulator HydG [Desulfacinum hydrothermale DSM 13146]|uniref:Two-component system, NtrC family, response regulator HydG n=1 Tax=Desulfacinum hydrothermale DSM 13146 TaxID=1121390 RepID=A0A1W1XNT0_9BACT|nr:sigma-54 dependent transcriptional regulator [Desulfacinum hydrothermale]SMC25623.1 two-component system, NtrC family, response regulator HydG [Desulfacinum hydrothermale DSM 13146]